MQTKILTRLRAIQVHRSIQSSQGVCFFRIVKKVNQKKRLSKVILEQPLFILVQTPLLKF